MKKLAYGILAALLSSTAICQPVTWDISEVKGPKDTIVGYIYYTNATGTQIGAKTEKLFTSLRLVCSTKSVEPPLMIIKWDTLSGNSVQYVRATVDGKIIPLNDQWFQDESIVYRAITYPDPLVQRLKQGTTVTFTWIDNDAVRRTTAFDLRDMKKGLSDFNTFCHTQI